jgi:hypothetical protein
MMGYLTQVKSVSAGQTTIVGPLCYVSLKDNSNDTSHYWAMYLKFACYLTVIQEGAVLFRKTSKPKPKQNPFCWILFTDFQNIKLITVAGLTD